MAVGIQHCAYTCSPPFLCNAHQLKSLSEALETTKHDLSVARNQLEDLSGKLAAATKEIDSLNAEIQDNVKTVRAPVDMP
jgi:chromosome segregation ATPase